MATTIESVTIGTLEKRLVLNNSQWAATLNIGTSWNSLLVGGRFALSDSGANITGTPRLYMGVMSAPASGMTNGPLGASTSHFIGVVSNIATLVRGVSGSFVKYDGGGSGSFVGVKKVGATLTTNGLFSPVLSASEATLRLGFLVQITKGSPNFLVDVCWPDTDATSIDCTYTLFQSAMEINDATLAGNEALLDTSGQVYSSNNNIASIATDEATNGFFDSICIAWDRTTPNLHVSEMLFAKMS